MKNSLYMLIVFVDPFDRMPRMEAMRVNPFEDPKVFIFDDYERALWNFAETPCYWSEIVEVHEGEHPEEVLKDHLELYKDEDWLEENVYKYI